MKRDSTESLTTIRKLCNEVLEKKVDRGPDNFFLIAQIEWICRHALEDYATPCIWTNEFGTKCSKDAIEMWTWVWSPGDVQYFCEEHVKESKSIFMSEHEDEVEGNAAFLDSVKITKL